MDDKIKLREKIAFGMGDFASCLSWATVGSYLMIYYTDVALIPAAAVGTMFMITRIWDAINDPIMGIIVDKTHTRWGKCRPYFLWMCVPMAVLIVLTFTVPDFSPTGKLVYVYITFTLMTMAYTAINIPVTAILPLITRDSNQRNVLGVFRMLGALFGSVGVGMATLGLVAALGGGNQQKGYTLTLTVYAILSTIMFLFVFANLKERVSSSEDSNKTTFKESLKAVKGNIPWFIAITLGFLMNLFNAMRGAGLVYYMTYNLRMPGLIPILSMIGLTMVFSLFTMPSIVKRLGKKKTVIVGNIIAAIGAIMIATMWESVPVLFIGAIINSLGMGLGFGLIWSMIADSVDYGTWISGVRAEGLLSAACSFGQKLGTGVGTAAAAWILAAGGYVANAEAQASSALTAIHFNYAVVPIIVSVLNIIIMIFWKMDKLVPQMTADLNAGKTRDQKAIA